MTPLAELLADRIRRFGPLTFADYMRECLYHPVQGYYSKAESKRFADYYTSVDVHPIFGRLLARQFVEMWENLGRPVELMIVEAGAGVGRCAVHALAANRPRFARSAMRAPGALPLRPRFLRGFLWVASFPTNWSMPCRCIGSR